MLVIGCRKTKKDSVHGERESRPQRKRPRIDQNGVNGPYYSMKKWLD